MKPNTTAEDFAAWIAENKPHLLEIEEMITAIGLYGEADIRVYVRGGRVEKVQFYGGKTWLRDKRNDKMNGGEYNEKNSL